MASATDIDDQTAPDQFEVPVDMGSTSALIMQDQAMDNADMQTATVDENQLIGPVAIDYETMSLAPDRALRCLACTLGT